MGKLKTEYFLVRYREKSTLNGLRWLGGGGATLLVGVISGGQGNDHLGCPGMLTRADGGPDRGSVNCVNNRILKKHSLTHKKVDTCKSSLAHVNSIYRTQNLRPRNAQEL